MADIPQGSVHLPQLRFRIPPFRVRSAAQAAIRETEANDKITT